MHDTLGYFQRNAVYRKYHQNDLTFAMLYHHNENFLLPLSHDEVVHGKGSLIGRMPGDDWQQFANLRTLVGYQWLFPGKKLMFMGGEIGQRAEWNANGSLDWHLLNSAPHRLLQRWVEDLNRAYRDHPALHLYDCKPAGFEWVDCSDTEQSVVSLLRKGSSPEDLMLVVCNFTPVPRMNYHLGVPHGGCWTEVLNSDAKEYGSCG